MDPIGDPIIVTIPLSLSQAFLTEDVMGKQDDLDFELIEVAAKLTTFPRLSLQNEHLLPLPIFCLLTYCFGGIVGTTVATEHC
jgi:hypothetical protein